MNIKEKFNNLFKYPAFYWLSLCGWTCVIYYLLILILYFIRDPGAGMVAFVLTLIEITIFLALLIPTPVIHIFCKDSDALIDSPKILNNKLVRTLTTIGFIGFVSFIGFLIFNCCFLIYVKNSMVN